MVKRTSFEGDVCAVARSLDVIGDWWSLLIIRDALGGVRRFSQFQRSLGAAKNMLASRLKTLVAHGILDIEPAQDGGAHLEYAITDKGRALMPVLAALSQWGREHLFEPGETCSVILDAKTKKPIDKVRVHAKDGRELKADDVVVGRGRAR
ncbi:MAG: transcriptional regulator [Rhodospirillales bacterium]|nr:transcriptional regulator [Rhodospirillales bacterium]